MNKKVLWIVVAVVLIGAAIYWRSASATSIAGHPCGGLTQRAYQCPTGYVCNLGPQPDKGGVCVPAK